MAKTNIMQRKKVSREIVKFMKMVNKKVHILNEKYYKATGLYVGSFQATPFNQDEINYYKRRS